MTMPGFDTDRWPDQLRLQVDGRPLSGNRNGFHFSDTMKIAILNKWYNTHISFVQTDKPIYKPGQLGT